jgi:hypothetical protein
MQGKQLEPAMCRMYNSSTMQYSSGGQIPVQQGCFAFMFTNIGDQPATVNGMVVYPSATPTTDLGDSRTISGHEGDLYMGNITISFDATGGGTNPRLELVQLFYILENSY